MKRWKVKSAAWLLLVCLCLGLLPIGQAQAAKTQVIVIHDAEELAELARLCTLDSWSRDKCVQLSGNINVAGQDFHGIPTFGGVFDGCGYAVTGLALAADDPVQGLFRYVQPGATVQNVTVYGTITAAGANNTFGGIAGVNRGTIRAYRFRGSIRGESVVGGIAGINDTSGQVSGCLAEGVFLAEKYAGGIAGKNFGQITSCTNSGSVNISASERRLKIEDISVEQLVTSEQLTQSKTSDLRGHTDSGGIAGYSTGILDNCVNHGAVGYQHMGYNIGGIVGRQSGYLRQCTNDGRILGRKDVGGIVGQMEPYIILRDADDVLSQLEKELVRLNALVDQTLDDVDGTNVILSARMDQLSEYTGAAQESSHQLVDQTIDFVDDNVAQLNTLSATISHTLEQAEPITADLRRFTEQMGQAADDLRAGLSDLKDAMDSTGTTFYQLEQAMDELQSAVRAAERALERIDTALQLAKEALTSGDQELIDQALGELKSGILQLSQAVTDAGTAAGKLSEALQGVEDWGGLVEKREEILAAASELSRSLTSAGESLGQITTAVDTLLGQVDWQTMREAAEEAYRALGELRRAADRVEASFDALSRAMASAEAASADFSRAAGHLSQAMATLSQGADNMSSALRKLETLTAELAAQEPVQLSDLGGAYRESSNQLYAALSGIAEQMEALGDEVSTQASAVTADLRAVNDQFNVVMLLVIDALSLEQNDLSELVEDTSDEDISQTTQGKVQASVNHGTVQADINVGGIAGSMAIEYDLDPEDDRASGKRSLNTRYETKAVVQACVSDGQITAKKNCVGAIVGRMDLGTVIDSVGYGELASESGDYVGGIAGLSTATVRKCFARCTLSGRDYVGGIAGSGKNIRGCYTLVDIAEASGSMGAVAGERITETGVRDNYFVDRGWAGIGGISYSGLAEPLSYAQLCQVPGLPEGFGDLTLTFTADGQVLETVPFAYGADLSALVLPAIPEKEGYYSYWPDFDYSSVTFSAVLEAVYAPWITVLDSVEQSDAGLPLALAEGHYDSEALLHVTAQGPAFAADDTAVAQTVWTLTLENAAPSANGQCAVRLLAPAEKGRVTLWRWQADGGQPVEYERNGHYLLTTMPAEGASFCLVTAPRAGAPWLLSGLVGAMMILAALIWRKIRGHRAQQEKEQQDA